jgi:hypothetical protein
MKDIEDMPVECVCCGMVTRWIKTADEVAWNARFEHDTWCGSCYDSFSSVERRLESVQFLFFAHHSYMVDLGRSMPAFFRAMSPFTVDRLVVQFSRSIDKLGDLTIVANGWA